MLGNFSHDNIIQYLFTTILLYPNKTVYSQIIITITISTNLIGALSALFFTNYLVGL